MTQILWISILVNHFRVSLQRYEIVNGVVEVKGDNMETGDGKL